MKFLRPLYSFCCCLFFYNYSNHLGWKKPLGSLSPTINLTLPHPPLNHVPEHHSYTSFKDLQ